MRWGVRGVLALCLLVAGTVAAGAGARPLGAATSTAPTNLLGTFSIAPGHCATSGPPSGSYLEIELDGTPVPNVSSSCTGGGGAFTPLAQGSQGLVTGAFQPDPVPTFDALGNSKASAIIAPVRFLANALGLATTCADQSTAPTRTGSCAAGAKGFQTPSLEAVAPGQGHCPSSSSDECLSGDLSGLGVTWAGFPVQALLADPLTNLAALLTQLGTTCPGSSGCFGAGVAADPVSGTTSCVTATAPASCALFGTFDPTNGAYSLGISTELGIGLLGHAVLQIVLRGTFTAKAPGTPPTTTPDPTDGSGPPAQPAGATTPGGASTGSDSPGNGSATATSPPSADGQLTGTFTLGPSTCVGSTPFGSYFSISYASVTEGNPSSSCAGGAITLLQPGTGGLGVGSFTPDPSPTFDAKGNSLAGAIITPVAVKGAALGLATSPQDVQDAPGGPPVFAAPQALVQGTNLAVDLRSLNATYDGTANDSCTQSYGVGCWLEGSRLATGTFDPSTGNFTLTWSSSQDFTGGSGEVDFHLSGHFSGTTGPVDPSLAQALTPSSYSVTSQSVDSESANVPGPLGASSGINTPTTVAASVPRPAGLGAPSFGRVRVSFGARSARRSGSPAAPILLVALGVLVIGILLLVGRRSRTAATELKEEQA